MIVFWQFNIKVSWIESSAVSTSFDTDLRVPSETPLVGRPAQPEVFEISGECEDRPPRNSGESHLVFEKEPNVHVHDLTCKVWLWRGRGARDRGWYDNREGEPL